VLWHNNLPKVFTKNIYLKYPLVNPLKYIFRVDSLEVEAWIEGDDLYLAVGDIKDGLLKMILFSNLEGVRLERHIYNPIAVLKLTTEPGFSKQELNSREMNLMEILKREAHTNQFKVLINNNFVV